MDSAPPVETITIKWPRKSPDGMPITKTELKAAWTEYLAPLQEGASLLGEMSEELRTLLATFRHVYAAMPENEESNA